MKNLPAMHHDSKCAICVSTGLLLVKESNIGHELSSDDFAATDARYGVTAAIYRCANCGFLQCSDVNDPLSFYESLADVSYEAGREMRRLQMRKLLRRLATHRSGGTLLDIGAATGILVEEALSAGYTAVGVEPSAAFHKRAQDLEMPVHRGTFPHPDLTGTFDIITLIDVIEHVLGTGRAASRRPGSPGSQRYRRGSDSRRKLVGCPAPGLEVVALSNRPHRLLFAIHSDWCA